MITGVKDDIELGDFGLSVVWRLKFRSALCDGSYESFFNSHLAQLFFS